MDWLKWWLWCSFCVHMVVGTAIFLDQEKALIRRHAQSPGIMLWKIAGGPITLFIIGLRIFYAPFKFLWSHRLAGCVVGNRPPIKMPENMRREYQMECERCGAKAVGAGIHWGYEYACGTIVGPRGEWLGGKQTQKCVKASADLQKELVRLDEKLAEIQRKLLDAKDGDVIAFSDPSLAPRMFRPSALQAGYKIPLKPGYSAMLYPGGAGDKTLADNLQFTQGRNSIARDEEEAVAVATSH